MEKSVGLVECCVHGDKMNEPIRTLPCLHSACLTCLVQYCAASLTNQASTRHVKCPKCHDLFQVPDSSVGGVESLPVNSFTASAVSTAHSSLDPNKVKCEMCEESAATSRCKDCAQWYCDSCKKFHLRAKSSSHHQFATIEEVFKEGSTVLKTRVAHCPKHAHQEINSFCKTDQIAVCPQCGIESHSGHTFDQLVNVAQEFKASISSLVENAKTFHSRLAPAVDALNKAISSVNEQANKASDEIHTSCEQIREYVNERERQLKGEVEEVRKEKEVALISQKRGMEILEVGIRESSAVAEMMLKEGSEIEIVSSQKEVVSRFTKLENEGKRCQLTPATATEILFVKSSEQGVNEVRERIMKLGSVRPAGTVSMIRRGGAEKGDLGGIGGDSRPIYRRDYSTVGAKPVIQFGSEGSNDGEFSWPFAVTCNLQGDIFVVDNGNHRVQVFDKTGTFLFKFGSKGAENGQFSRSQGITFDKRNHQIVVSDSGNHRIQIFDEKGGFIRSFGSEGDADGELQWVSGILVDTRGNYVVADFYNNRMQIFDSDGQFVMKFGTNDELKEPFGVGLLSNGNIVVSEHNASNLKLFDSDGKLILVFGEGQVQYPWHLFVDSNDNILVADADNDQLQVFKSDGSLLQTIGAGQLTVPLGVCMDVEGRIIVAEYEHRISIF